MHIIDQAQITADERVPAITITRDFKAAPAQVLRAHTDPELFAQWTGPEGLTTEVVTWDARSGGEWRYIARREGEQFGFRGTFHEVSDRRIVQTFAFDGFPESVALETMTFEDLGNGYTRLRAQSLTSTFEARDAMLRSGMEEGVHDGYAAIDRLIESGQL